MNMKWEGISLLAYGLLTNQAQISFIKCNELLTGLLPHFKKGD